MSDYISRKAAVNALTKVALCVADSHRRAVATCINEVELLPAAWVEPKREWNAYPAQKPKKSGKYFAAVESDVFPGRHYADVLQYDEIGWRDGCCYVSGVSHWMPLPKPPEVE